MTTEQSLAALDAFVQEQNAIYMLLFNLLLRANPDFRDHFAEAIRKILNAPSTAQGFSPSAQAQLRSLRDGLLTPPPQALVDALNQPSIRPVPP
jgi:hypothetical protein